MQKIDLATKDDFNKIFKKGFTWQIFYSFRVKDQMFINLYAYLRGH